MAFQRRPDPPITIGEILQKAPGSKENKNWINGILTCGICDVKPNKIGFSATLFDPSNTNVAILAKFYGSGIDRLEGQVITMSGGGMSWGEYKGACELAVSEKTRIECEGQAQPAFQAPTAARPAPYSAPQGATRVVGTPLPPAARPAAPAGFPVASRSTAEDIALGRSTNNAIALLSKFGADKPIDWLDSDDFRMRLYVLTSDLLHVEKAVAHKPAPTSKQRAGGMSVRQPAAPVQAEVEEEQAPAPAPAPVKPVSRGVPGPSGAAYDPASDGIPGLDDNCPF